MQQARSLAASHEVNDLDLVAIVKQGVIEGAAGNDLAVQFDRDAAAVQAAFFDELRNARTAALSRTLRH